MAKGGAKGTLEQGTITKKGKRRVNSRKKADTIADAKGQADEKRKSDNQRIENDRARVEEDFTSKSNLGDLDLDSFLKTVADDGEEENASGDEDDGAMEEDASDSEGEVVDFDSEDDEDIEAAEARMKAEMEKLAENDPDFHEYLQNNESSLLDFKNEIGGIEGEDDDDDDEE